MKEESQLEEMRAALRGERERAEASRPKLLESFSPPVVEEPPPEPEPEVEAPREPPGGGRLRSFFRRF